MDGLRECFLHVHLLLPVVACSVLLWHSLSLKDSAVLSRSHLWSSGAGRTKLASLNDSSPRIFFAWPTFQHSVFEKFTGLCFLFGLCHPDSVSQPLRSWGSRGSCRWGLTSSSTEHQVTVRHAGLLRYSLLVLPFYILFYTLCAGIVKF